MLPALTYSQVDFSGGEITSKAARRDDVKLQRSGLRRSVNTRALSTGALAQRFGRAAYNLDDGRTEIVRFSDTDIFEFLFGNGLLTIRDRDGAVVNTFTGQPWSLSTMDQVVFAQTESEVYLTYPGVRPRRVSRATTALIDPNSGTASSDMVANAVFPDVEATATFTNGSGTTNHATVLPDNIQVGDLIVIAFRTMGTANVDHTTPVGWDLIATRANNGRTSIYAREATGSDTAPVIVSSGSGRRSAGLAYRISGASDIAGAFANSNTFDPPSLSPSWGSAPNLWLALLSHHNLPFSGGMSGISAPTNYSNLFGARTGGGNDSGTSHGRIASARRQLLASSDNPGDMSVQHDYDNPHAATVAIQPNFQDEHDKVFDGIFSKSSSEGAAKASATSAIAYLNLSANPKAVGSAIVRGSNNAGFVSGATPSVTLTLYGKNGSAPTLGSPGTSLGSTNFTDTANESGGRTITSSDTSTAYDYLAVVVSHNGSANQINLAQIAFLGPTVAADQWTIGPFEFERTGDGALRQPYHRYATKGITLLPSARTGAITVTFSEPVLNAGHVGTSFRFHDREIVITSVSNSLSGTANVIQTLPPMRRVTCTDAAGRDGFQIGQVVRGVGTQAEGLIVAYNSTANLDVVMIRGDNFIASERIVSETGNTAVSGTPSSETLAASPYWDEALMSTYRGWPRSVTYDRSRLTFCDLPQRPRMAVWSAVGAPRDMHVGAEADEGFVESVPGPGRVLHIMGGADQYVLTDIGVMYIPVSESNPLAPGRVAFRPIAAVGAGSVRPVSMHEGVVYASANGGSLTAIVPTGQTSFPYRTAAISEFHADLFTGVRCLAAMTGGGVEAEQYLWVCQNDGTALVGKFDSSNDWVGFSPVTGAGSIKWIASLAGDVRFNTDYGGASWVMERLDEEAYLDCAVPVNDAEPSLRPSPDDGELGRLWFLAGLTVDLMDGERYLGSRLVDDDGFIVEEDGDGLDDIQGLVAGFGWTVEASPYLPAPPEGEERGQRMRRRRVKRAAATVKDTTQFTFMGRDFGGETPVSDTFRAPGVGRAFDPEITLVKTVPGPITILELAGEITV